VKSSQQPPEILIETGFNVQKALTSIFSLKRLLNKNFKISAGFQKIAVILTLTYYSIVFSVTKLADRQYCILPAKGIGMKKFLTIAEGRISPSDENGKIIIYLNPDHAEKEELLNKYNIDEHNLNSALDPDEISRLEFEEDHTVVIFKRPKNYSTNDNLLFKVTSFGVFYFKDRIIIVQPDEIQMFEDKQSQKVDSLNEAFLKLIYATISHFLGHLKVINMISDSIEQKIESSTDSKYMMHLYTLEKSLVYYLTGINSNSSVIEKIKFYSNKFAFTEENIELLDDMIIENNQCRNLSRTYSEILTVMITARNSIASDKLSSVMKRLTVITTIFMPLTMITGIGGMSEWSMMTGPKNWPVSYLLFLVGLIGLGVGTYYIFKWKDWI